MKKKESRKIKNQTTFTLEIDSKGLVIFAILVLLTAVTIFYLGMIFGKANRDPNLALKDPAGLTESGEEQPLIVPPKDLKIYDVHDKEKPLSNLQKEFAEISKKTDTIIEKEKQADRQEAEERRATAEQAQKIAEPEKPAQPAKPPTVNWPETTTTQKNQKLFTIQVMATRNKTKADRIINQLKQKSYNAYVMEAKLEGTTIYRVRVGKTNKKQIEALRTKLEKSVAGLGRLAIIQL